ncbi:putative NRPS-like enzyme [Thozetella sp. PMI_491]|nr:putative NRPS-like enzyme [Thozetella sp. PMI_491]
MASLTPDFIQQRIDRFGKLYLVDDLIRQRGKDEKQYPILGYPVSDNNASEYEYFNGKQLDLMVDEACRVLVRNGFKNEGKTIALYSPSDLSFIITFFALFRLGYKVLTISIRLGSPACINLLDNCRCNIILHGNTPRIKSTISEVASQRPHVVLSQMLTREDFDKPNAPPQTQFQREIKDLEAEHTSVALTMHSSGSTGLPKPLHLSHRSVLNTLIAGTEWHSFNPLPWYHLHGLITSIQAMYHRKTAHLFGTTIPLTTENLVSALRAIRPEICHMVPYALKLIAEKQEGIELLKACERVTGAGARTPDELGDRLIQEGVKFAVVFGLTEVGHMGDSVRRPPGDDAWNYIRPYPHVVPHMFFKKLDENNFESVYLKSHPALMTTNSDDPPGSFHSKDIFTPHPTIPGAWKYVARDDDRITLLSGEKILPLTIEDIIRKNPLLRDALMVGNDRLQPGLLVFRAELSRHLSDYELVKAIWPDIQAANAIADEFAITTEDMVLPLGAEVEYPATDKKNIIRAAAYVTFEQQIESLYSRLDCRFDLSNGAPVNSKTGIPGLEEYLLRALQEQVGLTMPDTRADFFASGVDSLRAAQIRRLLQRSLDLRDHPISTNLVYDAGNIQGLARRLQSMLTGEPLPSENTTESKIAEIEAIVLTGATGGLGAHILAQLLVNPEVKHIYALVRGESPLKRVLDCLRLHGLASVVAEFLDKLEVVPASDLSQPLLGLSSTTYEKLRQQTTGIVHAAWPVNFNLSLSSFIPHLQGTQNLLQLSLDVPFNTSARVLFASSISTAFQAPKSAKVAEAPAPSLSYAAPTGYAKSKLVGEKISEAAGRAGGDIAIARIGQITGDTVNGIWNDTEAVPLMIRSAVELGSLPTLDNKNGKCEWIPVAYYNIVSPNSFDWNEELIPALRESGMNFSEVPFEAWLKKLRTRGSELGAEAEVKLPAIKLADYFEQAQGSGSTTGGLEFETDIATRQSPNLRHCPDVIRDVVPKLVHRWLRSWT